MVYSQKKKSMMWVYIAVFSVLIKVLRNVSKQTKIGENNLPVKDRPNGIRCFQNTRSGHSDHKTLAMVLPGYRCRKLVLIIVVIKGLQLCFFQTLPSLPVFLLVSALKRWIDTTVIAPLNLSCFVYAT